MTCSHSSPALACRNQTRSPTRGSATAAPEQRRLHLAGALGGHSRSPAGRRARQPALPAGPDAIQPPPSTVAMPRRRAAYDGQREEGGRGRGAAAVASNKVGPYSPEPAVTSVTAGSAAVAGAAGAAAVDELGRCQLADRVDRGGAPAQQLATEARCIRRIAATRRRCRAGRRRRRRSAPRTTSSRPARSPAARRGAGQPGGVLGRVHRGAAYADVQRPPAPRTRRDRGRRGPGRPPARRAASTRSRWAGWSTIRVRAAAARRRPARRSRCGRLSGRRPGRRRGHAGEPQRLGQRERHDAGEPGPARTTLEQGAAAHRLAGDPDRLAAGPADQLGGVVAKAARSIAATASRGLGRGGQLPEVGGRASAGRRVRGSRRAQVHGTEDGRSGVSGQVTRTLDLIEPRASSWDPTRRGPGWRTMTETAWRNWAGHESVSPRCVSSRPRTADEAGGTAFGPERRPRRAHGPARSARATLSPAWLSPRACSSGPTPRRGRVGRRRPGWSPSRPARRCTGSTRSSPSTAWRWRSSATSTGRRSPAPSRPGRTAAAATSAASRPRSAASSWSSPTARP